MRCKKLLRLYANSQLILAARVTRMRTTIKRLMTQNFYLCLVALNMENNLCKSNASDYETGAKSCNDDRGDFFSRLYKLAPKIKYCNHDMFSVERSFELCTSLRSANLESSLASLFFIHV